MYIEFIDVKRCLSKIILYIRNIWYNFFMEVNMIDSHCHLDCCSDIERIVNDFDGIIITSGYDDKSNLVKESYYKYYES